MRKLIILAASLVALAALIATPFANAATANADGSVTVSKGDIQVRHGLEQRRMGQLPQHPHHKRADPVPISSPPTTAACRVDVPGGWLPERADRRQLHPDDEYFSNSVDEPGELVQRLQRALVHLDPGGIDTKVTPIRNSQQKVTGYRVERRLRPREGRLRVLHPAHDRHVPPYGDGDTARLCTTPPRAGRASIAGSGALGR